MLGAGKHTQRDVRDARRETIEEEGAWALITSCDTVVVAKGKSMVEWTPSADNRDEILKAAMGRSGTLRAPTVRVENTLVIGFNEAVYARFFS
ncbi:hypothetical protein JCM14469_28480 [Desulfatiferula olefinivorans]